MNDDDSDDETPAAAKRRFETELEFVQALANPEYLHHLAQNLYFDDPDEPLEPLSRAMTTRPIECWRTPSTLTAFICPTTSCQS